MNNTEAFTAPAALDEFLWSIQQQFKFGATSLPEATDMAIAWAESGGMTYKDLAECRSWIKANR